MFLGRLGQKTSPIRISAIQSVLEFYEALQQALDETNTTCHDEYGTASRLEEYVHTWRILMYILG